MSALSANLRCPIPASCSSSSAHCRRHVVSCSNGRRSDMDPSWCRNQLHTRPKLACRAEERSRDSLQTSQSEKLKVPDTPPSKERTNRIIDEASTSQQQSGEITDELKMLQQRKREQSSASAPTGYFQSILQEVRLIEWPRPKQALTNTVLVIGIVGASSVILFAINSTLAELSKISYVR